MEKQALESEKSETATDSEFQKEQGGGSEKVDCHDFTPTKSRNDEKLESCSRTSLESLADSKKWITMRTSRLAMTSAQNLKQILNKHIPAQGFIKPAIKNTRASIESATDLKPQTLRL